jgi:sugar phosphate permease
MATTVEQKPAEAISKDDEIDLKAAITTADGQVEDLDEAGLFLQERNFTPAYLAELLSDHALNKKILRKIDFSIMPLLCGTYFLQYIDKQALSYAAVFDLFKTTHTTSSQYSWLVSIFYFAYLFAEWPSSYLAQRFSTSLIVGSFIIAWGSILLITASCSNFTGLAICRFLLGCFESVVTPCFMLIVSM